MFSPSLLLLLAAASYMHGEELTQPASMTVQPGQSLSIHCKVSYSITSYYTDWIRQPAGKTLEWIGHISGGGSLYYSEKLKTKFSISRDTATNTITIRGQNLQTEDTDVYYCARNAHTVKTKSFYFFCFNTHHDLYIPPAAAAGSRVHCVELIQTGSTVLTPGQSLTLTCKVSGYSVTDSSYCTDWIRQPAGKTLEWIGEICGSGSTYYSEKLKSRFQVSRDTSSNTRAVSHFS
ncbi:immunoglobulin alpha-2 heavy chain-like [Neoarius graeffei]|uniref:immunoglobulin alpha-2 heavy chain-like n=1 Tax=Neoarius graeffei TaxID=443677 RepID=UPI00298D0848|nr:immunoglobulin alpha-2 heavy chain-like [Neoarius graeffei]